MMDDNITAQGALGRFADLTKKAQDTDFSRMARIASEVIDGLAGAVNVADAVRGFAQIGMLAVLDGHWEDPDYAFERFNKIVSGQASVRQALRLG